MHAVLLAAGLGSRLAPLTDHFPKCLTPINGVPLLYIWLHQLALAGFTDVWLNTNYLANQVDRFLDQVSPELNMNIHRVHERQLLGTAGTLNNIGAELSAEITLIIHADNLCNADLNLFVNAHKAKPAQCCATVMSFLTQDPCSCGILALDSENVITEFHEKVANPPSNLANAAVYIFDQELLRSIRHQQPAPFDISIEILPTLINKAFVWNNSGFHQDIGSIPRWVLAHSQFEQDMRSLQSAFNNTEAAEEIPEIYQQAAKQLANHNNAKFKKQLDSFGLPQQIVAAPFDAVKEHDKHSIILANSAPLGFSSYAHFQNTKQIVIPITLVG